MPRQYSVELATKNNLSSGNKAENALAETILAEKNYRKVLSFPYPQKTHTHKTRRATD